MARGEGIKKVSELFAIYQKRLKAPQKSVVSAFQEVVDDMLGITLTPAQIAYTPATRTLMLRVPGAVKSEILLHKEEVLTHLKGRLGVQSAPYAII